MATSLDEKSKLQEMSISEFCAGERIDDVKRALETIADEKKLNNLTSLQKNRKKPLKRRPRSSYRLQYRKRIRYDSTLYINSDPNKRRLSCRNKRASKRVPYLMKKMILNETKACSCSCDKKELNKKRRLETHVYNIKRFHMILKWNYIIPNKRTSKSHLTKYLKDPLLSNMAIIHDTSYYAHFRIISKTYLNMKELFNKITDDIEIFDDNEFIKGKKENAIFIKNKDILPHVLIGIAKILIIPNKIDKIIVLLSVHRIIAYHIKEHIKNIIDENSSIDCLCSKLRRIEIRGNNTLNIINQTLKCNIKIKSQMERYCHYLQCEDPRLLRKIYKYKHDQIINYCEHMRPLKVDDKEIINNLFGDNINIPHSNKRINEYRYKKKKFINEINSNPDELKYFKSEKINRKMPCLIIIDNYCNIEKVSILIRDKWVNPLYQELIYSGGLVVGLSEWENINKRLGCDIFPDDFPNSIGYLEQCNEWNKEQIEYNVKRPKGKRKEIITYPFKWYLIGNECELKKDKIIITLDNEEMKKSILEMNLCYSKLELIKSIKQNENIYVRVIVKMIGKGVCENGSRILFNCNDKMKEWILVGFITSIYEKYHPDYKGSIGTLNINVIFKISSELNYEKLLNCVGINKSTKPLIREKFNFEVGISNVTSNAIRPAIAYLYLIQDIWNSI